MERTKVSHFSHRTVSVRFDWDSILGPSSCCPPGATRIRRDETCLYLNQNSVFECRCLSGGQSELVDCRRRCWVVELKWVRSSAIVDFGTCMGDRNVSKWERNSCGLDGWDRLWPNWMLLRDLFGNDVMCVLRNVNDDWRLWNASAMEWKCSSSDLFNFKWKMFESSR